ncbi:MAG: nucleotide exchange factor GrpE [Christensenella sp.]|nr:nucleotide exchange factor GrpE [Christensenella sp.]
MAEKKNNPKAAKMDREELEEIREETAEAIDAEDAQLAQENEIKDEVKLAEDVQKALEAERDDYLNALQRERADFENYKKRNASLAATSFQNGVADAVTAMLPILDNFERALAVECADQAFFDGTSMIMRQLKDALTGMGLAEITADGQFDPEFHNAVMQTEEEGFQTNQIVEVLQKGYTLNGKVLRHAMVKVAK